MKKLTFTLALSLTLGACSLGDDDAAPTEPSATQTSESAEPTTATAEPSETDSEPDEQETTKDEQDASEQTEAGPSDDSTEPGTEGELPPFTHGQSQSSDPFALEAQMFPESSRIGIHDGYDRLVVEYSGAQGEPGWYTEGVLETITHQGSGHVVELDGNVFLQVQVAGIRYPNPDEMDLTWDPEVPAGSVISDVEISYPFEGMHEINIGLEAGSDYRVMYLTDPARIVIDIKK